MTDSIVRELMGQYRNVDLIVEPERRGKSFALSKLLRRLNEGYDAMIYMGADDVPEKDSIERLLDRLENDPKLGLVGGRPIPVNDPNRLAGWMAHLLWDVHHEVCLQKPKVSGELCAIRAGTIYDAPPTIINDDAYLQFVMEMNDNRIAYEPSAVVHLRGPGTVSDFFHQRYRVTLGHYQVEQFLGGKLPTTYATRNVRIGWKVRERVGRLKEIGWFMFFLIVSGLVVVKALIDFYIRRRLPYKWKTITSTKSLG